MENPPRDPLFLRLKTAYSFFKDALGTAHREDSTPSARYKAVRSVNVMVTSSPASLARAWNDVPRAQADCMLEFLLKYYCESRADLDYDLSLIAFKQLFDRTRYAYLEASRPRLVTATADAPALFGRLDMLLGLLVLLYDAPIAAREFQAFEAERGEIGRARGRLTVAQPGANEASAQNVLDDAEERLNERLKVVNAERVVRLQQVKAAFSLLHDNAALVTGSAENAHQAAVEVYFSHLDPGQQAAVVTQVRDFVFAACEERAVRGEALDPDEHLVGILHALHAYGLGHALCAARLESIVRWVESRGAPPDFVEPFQNVVDQFCGDVWAHRFPLLAPSQQLYAVTMVRDLLGRMQTLKPRQVVDELAAILPMNSSSPTSWKHAHEADDPYVALHSLARRTSTHRASRDAYSMTSSTASRYFPQARSARW